LKITKKYIVTFELELDEGRKSFLPALKQKVMAKLWGLAGYFHPGQYEVTGVEEFNREV